MNLHESLSTKQLPGSSVVDLEFNVSLCGHGLINVTFDGYI